jgi:hypothetical protein
MVIALIRLISIRVLITSLKSEVGSIGCNVILKKNKLPRDLLTRLMILQNYVSRGNVNTYWKFSKVE